MKHFPLPAVSCTLQTVIGPVTVTECEMGVCRVDFDEGAAALQDQSLHIIGCDRSFFDARSPIPSHSLYFDSGKQLREYFSGERRIFDVPLVFPTNTSIFYKRVYAQLGGIPYGKVISYKQLAALAGSPEAARAAGNANARNKIPIILPCHRVITAAGYLGGYIGEKDGPGTGIKKHLLELEGVKFGKDNKIIVK